MVDLKPLRIMGFALLLTLLAPVVVCAQTVPVTFRWTAPRDGAAVTHYNVYQINDGGSPALAGTVADTTYVLAATPGVRYQIQVSGVALDGREGPLSLPSDVVFFDAGSPDLVVYSLTRSPASPTTADPITFTAVVQNTGTAPAGASTLHLRVGYETQGTSHNIPALAVGASATVTRLVPPLTTAQSYITTATADTNDVVAESNETNNTRQLSFTVTPPEIPQTGEEMPSAPLLRPNFPNPFNPQTTIAYGVPENADPAAPLSLEVYDLGGHLVRRLQVENSPGWHGAVWNGTDDAGTVRGSGQYVVRFRCGGAVRTWKMTMLK